MVEFQASGVHVRTPATSANLGPGFDAFGLALGVHDELDAYVAGSGVRVTVTGEGEGELPDDETHLVAVAALRALDLIGVRPPGLRITCRNAIPQARGMGSSSAAIVAGIMIARGLVVGGDRLLDDETALRLATEIEGHPDNVAPCLLGGFTIAWMPPAGARAVRLVPHLAVRPTVFVPDLRGLTAQARAALPATVPHIDAARNAGRSALLVYALTSAPELLFDATEDRIHQPYRAAGLPETAELVARLRSDGIAAVVSGAGPSVLALTAVDRPVPDTPGWQRLSPGFDAHGALVRPIEAVRYT